MEKNFHLELCVFEMLRQAQDTAKDARSESNGQNVLLAYVYIERQWKSSSVLCKNVFCINSPRILEVTSNF